MSRRGAALRGRERITPAAHAVVSPLEDPPLLDFFSPRVGSSAAPQTEDARKGTAGSIKQAIVRWLNEEL